MKYAAFVAAMSCVLPLAALLARFPRLSPAVWFVIGISPFGLSAAPALDIALVSWETWPGYAKGILVSACDLFAVAVFLSQKKSQSSLPFTKTLALYLFAAALSVCSAYEPAAAAFYVWQLLRVFLIYVNVARAGPVPVVVSSLFAGLVVGLCAEAAVVIWQRVATVLVQPRGTFSHQNALGAIANLITIPSFSLLLAGRGVLRAVGTAAGVVIAVLCASRATLLFLFIGCALVYIVSVARTFTQWKLMVGLGCVLVGALSTPVALTSLEKRFQAIPLPEHYDERAAHLRAAEQMALEHPFGVGANNYAYVAVTQGFSQRSRVLTTDLTVGATVHNVYILAMAETGFLGAISLMLLFGTVLIVAFKTAARYWRDPRGDLLLGIGIALGMLYLHSMVEWLFVIYHTQVIFALLIGTIAALARGQPELHFQTVSAGRSLGVVSV